MNLYIFFIICILFLHYDFPAFQHFTSFFTLRFNGGSIDKGYVAVRMRETGALFASRIESNSLLRDIKQIH